MKNLIIISIYFLLSMSLDAQEKKDITELFFPGIDTKSLDSTEHRFGTMYTHYHYDNVPYFTTDDLDFWGKDKKSNRYYLSKGDSSRSYGVVYVNKEQNIELYCGLHKIAVKLGDTNNVLVLKKRACKPDLLTFGRCGFYDFSYSKRDNTLYYTQKRVLLWNRRRKIKLDKYLN